MPNLMSYASIVLYSHTRTTMLPFHEKRVSIPFSMVLHAGTDVFLAPQRSTGIW